MLCLTRERYQAVILKNRHTGEEIKITSLTAGKVKIGFDAADDWIIRREELPEEWFDGPPPEQKSA